ncbi:MAG: hypothetical protein NTV08_00720 [Verrucomicrobia bacterium]|nr:hypothetical protein [Verrucomicrobiota bacterium]
MSAKPSVAALVKARAHFASGRKDQPALLQAQLRVFAALLLALLFSSIAVRADGPAPAAPKPPDRRELWVPMDQIGAVLGKNAVLLTREQYEALLRDGGREQGPKNEAPAGAVISSAVYRAVPQDKTAVIHAELIVNVLRDGWCEVPLDFTGAAIGEVKLDGEGVVTARNPVLREVAPAPQQGKMAMPERPALLILRGNGVHRVTLEMSTNIRTTNGVNGHYGLKSIALAVPGVAAGAFEITLPEGTTMEKSDAAMRVSKTADATVATVGLREVNRNVVFAWKTAQDGDAGKVPVRAQARVRYDIDAEKITGTSRIFFESQLGDLPLKFEVALPAGVKVLSVSAAELRGWEAANGKVTATLQDGARKSADIEILTELPPKVANVGNVGNAAAETVLPLPAVQGVPRIEGMMFIAGADNVIIKDVIGGARLWRIPTAEDRGERGFFGSYEFSGAGAAPRVVIQRTEPTVESDLDTLVEFRPDAIYLTRTLTLREQQGRRFSTAITLPAGEEFLDVRRIEEIKVLPNQPLAQSAQGMQGAQAVQEACHESEPEWTREGAVVSIKWSDEAAKPRVFRVRTRVEPEKWTQLPAEGVSFTLGDAKVAGTAKVAGYIALTADAAFRLEAQAGETLERRDGRSTPVHGEYAWFRREKFDLTVKIARRPSEVLAALTGYALPLEGVLDLRASMNYQFMGGGTRAVKLRVPKDIAQNFQFEGPQIAERALDGDVWTVTFQKELTGPYALGIAAQVPVAKQGAQDGGKGYSFAATVPVIAPLDVVRSSGLWAVEANTETEIRFDARGMNELDSLLAPQLADYTPRHRVIGVFGWLGADYALKLNGVRHAPAGMLTAVVDTLELNTVISTGGTHRHEAAYRLRSTGVEYLDVTLPPGAKLLSVAIDGTAVKPVADHPGNVRLPLPARRDADAPVLASLVYETPGGVWKNRGQLALVAPSIAAEIPVLKSSWRVWVPDGFSFSEIESNLPVPEAPVEKLLVLSLSEKLGEIAVGGIPKSHQRSHTTQVLEDLRAVDSDVEQLSLEAARHSAKSEATAAMVRKLNMIVFPKIDFRDATVREAFDFLVAKSKGRGVDVVLHRDAEVGNGTRITLTLNNVPLIEVIKYITDLANVKYKIEPDAVRIVPIGSATEEMVVKKWRVPPSVFRSAVQPNAPTARDFLIASGVSFSAGASATYSSASATLFVKNAQDQIDLVDQIIEIAASEAPTDSTSQNIKLPLSGPSTAPRTSAIQSKLKGIIFPKIDFRDTTVREAFEFLSEKAKALDPHGDGVNIVLRLGDEHRSDAPGGGTRITLMLNNVPLIEVIKYVTNLANLKYKIEPFAITIVPLGALTEELFTKQWRVPPDLMWVLSSAGKVSETDAKGALAAAGVSFPQGSVAMYSPVTSTLLVKNTQDNLDLLENIITSLPHMTDTPAAGGIVHFDRAAGQKSAGLLPVTLDLPKGGRVLVFEGLFAPERVALRYDDWWSRARALWMWFVSGGVAFYLLAERRPWRRTLWAVLVLSALPLCASAAWMPECNALLGGWLAGLVLNRIGAWCVFRVKKEVLA